MKKFDVVVHFKTTDAQYEELKNNLDEQSVANFYECCDGGFKACNGCIFISECNDKVYVTPKIINVVHVEEKYFTAEEKEIMKHAYAIGYRYIVRQRCGNLVFDTTIPKKDEYFGRWIVNHNDLTHLSDKFELIRWDDDKPVEIAKYIDV